MILRKSIFSKPALGHLCNLDFGRTLLTGNKMLLTGNKILLTGNKILLTGN